MKSRRTEAGVTQEEIAEALGYTTSVHYSYLEKNGKLPKKKHHREIIAQLLKVTLEELLEKEQSRPEDEVDILALLRKIVASAPVAITLADIRFLLSRETSLKRPLSSLEIRRLMAKRVTSTQSASFQVLPERMAA